jgi:hypothetical protein
MKGKHDAWPKESRHRKLLPSHLWVAQGKIFYLFHALLALLVMYPYLETASEPFRPWPLTALHSVVVAAIVYVSSVNIKQFAVAVALAVPTLVLYWIPGIPHADTLTLFFSALLYMYAVILILPVIVATYEGSSEEVYGATASYILLGLAWASLYQAVEAFYPGSYYVPAAYNLDGALTWSDYLFFSFTTLTTLGYGNMAPISSPARSLAILEAITGIIFIAVMLARVIGLSVTARLLRKGSKS